MTIDEYLWRLDKIKKECPKGDSQFVFNSEGITFTKRSDVDDEIKNLKNAFLSECMTGEFVECNGN